MICSGCPRAWSFRRAAANPGMGTVLGKICSSNFFFSSTSVLTGYIQRWNGELTGNRTPTWVLVVEVGFDFMPECQLCTVPRTR